jgi:nuclear pore complex protein Nup85
MFHVALYFLCFLRSIVRACLENLQSEASKNESSSKEVCLELVVIFYNVEFLWHLCEILYVDVIPGKKTFNSVE